MLQDVAADFALATARIPGKKRRAVVYHANASTALAAHHRLHLGQQVQREKHLPIANGWQAWPKAPCCTLGVFLLDGSFGRLPFHAIRWVGRLVVEGFAGVHVQRQGVAILNVRRVLPTDEHVGFANGVGLVFQLLAKQFQGGTVVELAQVLFCHAQNAAGTCRGVVHGAYHAGHGQHLLIAVEQQRHHQLNHIARRVLLTGGGHVVELAQQFFKRLAHVVVGDFIDTQRRFGKALHHKVEAVFFCQFVQRGSETEFLENVAHVLREAVNHGFEVVAHVVGGLRDVGQRKFRRVEKRVAADRGQHLVEVVTLALHGSVACPHRFAGGLQNAIEAAQDGEGQDDLAVFVFFEGTAQQFSVFPNKVGKFGHSGLLGCELGEFDEFGLGYRQHLDCGHTLGHGRRF